ncbi:TIGR01777 family oxidoreductase [Constantimarinum furrinae]|uniref:TIGR01777 family protein n=1 Tax=Constantimarinum furrinae TaxID=2562285 RepID=A0A7G8PR01_9FLAO|nr:TIGR01777 family oxidoreductase [Constantimarinum furrinae]QNJ96767.1 TIGR01777 family protein [Constantimarinum furrinae]
MKVLITGATGLIGAQLVKYCHDENYIVHYLTTSKNKIETLPNFKGFYWDPYKGEIDTAAFEGVTVIVNLVGASISKRWTKSYKKVILESRTKTANLLYDTLKKIKHDVRQLISASGVGVYPDSKTKLYFENESETGSGFLAEVVLAWEAAADQFKQLGIDVTKVRTGVVLSAEQGAFPKIVAPIDKGLGAPLGSGDQWMSWIHLEDIACIYLQMIKNEWEGTFNAVAPTPVTNNKMTREIADKLNVTLWLPNVPSFILRLVLGEMATLVLDGQLVSSKKIESHGYKFRYHNIESALKELL